MKFENVGTIALLQKETRNLTEAYRSVVIKFCKWLFWFLISEEFFLHTVKTTYCELWCKAVNTLQPFRCVRTTCLSSVEYEAKQAVQWYFGHNLADGVMISGFVLLFPHRD